MTEQEMIIPEVPEPVEGLAKTIVEASGYLLRILAGWSGLDPDKVSLDEEEKEMVAEPLKAVLQKRLGGQATPEMSLAVALFAVFAPRLATIGIALYKKYGNRNTYRPQGVRKDDHGAQAPEGGGESKRKRRRVRLRAERPSESGDQASQAAGIPSGDSELVGGSDSD